MVKAMQERICSDKAAVGSVEAILLIALAVGIVTVIGKFIRPAIEDSAKNSADAIRGANK